MRYSLKILSPLHIGNGFNISPMEYVIDDKFYRINMDSLFRDREFNTEEFIENAKMGSFYLGEFYGDIAKRHKEYVIDISNSAEKSLRQRKSEIREFIKTGGNIYIPGSSIKGAIRTALLWYILKENEDLYFKMEEYLQKIIREKTERPNKKYVDNEIEKIVFGREPTHDLLKGLSVSDTNTASCNNLRIDEVRILTTRKYGYGWKGFNIILETLKIGTKFNIEIKKDEFFVREDVSKKLGFDDKVIYLDNLKDICNDYNKDFIDYELTFLKKYNDGNLDEIIKFYENLGEEDGFLLHISWGAGWHGMTVGRLINENLFESLRKMYRLGKRRNEPRYVKPFPKTRRIIFEDEKPKYPLGWIKLEEVK